MPVQSVTESQLIDLAGNTTDVYEITFTVADRPGVFTVNVPVSGNPVEDARAQLAAVKQAVEAIYASPV